MSKREALTEMQKVYIWLAGTHPTRTLEQGRGYRGAPVMYALDDEAESVIVFGYSNPPYFLERRGLLRRSQAGRNHYTLTAKGEQAFAEIQKSGLWADFNLVAKKVNAAPKKACA